MRLIEGMDLSNIWMIGWMSDWSAKLYYQERLSGILKNHTEAVMFYSIVSVRVWHRINHVSVPVWSCPSTLHISCCTADLQKVMAAPYVHEPSPAWGSSSAWTQVMWIPFAMMNAHDYKLYHIQVQSQRYSDKMFILSSISCTACSFF